MNKAALKNYAPAARQEFIRAITGRANALGFSDTGTMPMTVSGDVAVIGGRAFPAAIAPRRVQLEKFIQLRGFTQAMEEAAYTWFNRLVALRYMEIHGYLKCGCMVLGNPSGAALPAILEHIADLEPEMLPSADLARARDLRLAGDKEEELYRLLLIAQCNALSLSMPLLFEKISNASELLLPENLLHSDSIIRHLVEGLTEEDWDSVEIVGWLYQFYISEKKDQVIGKVVKTEDIPAATQLFTPNWIVQYMVQNTLGRQWLAVHPGSALREAMPYYIEPAPQEPDVQAALAATTPRELNPEALTFLDPACGSGHILVEAYNILKRIYQEQGYRPREVPRLILEKNLYGLDIDTRAAQLSQFVLLMLARKDDRRILDNPPVMNIMALTSSRAWDYGNGHWAQGNPKVDALAQVLLRDRDTPVACGTPRQLQLIAVGTQTGTAPVACDVSKDELATLLCTFADADTFGSLIRVPQKVKAALPRMEKLLEAAQEADQQSRDAAELVAPLVRQAGLLTRQYDCVVANPPYMGTKGMNAQLKTFAKDNFPDSKGDLFAMFMERGLEMTQKAHYMAMVTMQSWMFLSSFENLRKKLLAGNTLQTIAHLGTRGFDSISGEVVQTTAFTLVNSISEQYKGTYYRLIAGKSEAEKSQAFKEDASIRFTVSAADFKKIPGSPVAYWVSERVRQIFAENPPLGDVANAAVGLQTGDNNRFLRQWFEICHARIGFGMASRAEALASQKKWFPYNKGGEFRKWYGNQDYVVNWKNDGEEIRNFVDEKGKVRSRPQNTEFYFRESVSWSDVTSASNAFRYYQNGFIHDSTGHSAFGLTYSEKIKILLYLNNSFINIISKILNPTLHFHIGYFNLLPNPREIYNLISEKLSEQLVFFARTDWDNYETSWDFTAFPLLRPEHHKPTLADSYASARAEWQAMTDEILRLEEENNRIFIDAYGLQDELTPDVPLKEITLTCNPFYRYSVDAAAASAEDKTALEARLRADTMKELLSYALGCMMGRYSLDAAGLVYAAAGNADFDAAQYRTFPADDDGIVPVTDEAWFADDAAKRFTEFVAAVWDAPTREENLHTVADTLEPKAGDTPEATIRRYLSSKFFKEQHLRTYKKRPIYWLFSSGKQKAFECLVYLHRYNDATLPRMRAQYVTPLQGKLAGRIEYLEKEVENATSTAARKALAKEKETMLKKQEELRRFDEQLRHYADMRISLDLDDGVKVNYAKFGPLLAEVKAVTGGKED